MPPSPILFLGANGFPSKAYLPLLHLLAGKGTVHPTTILHPPKPDEKGLNSIITFKGLEKTEGKGGAEVYPCDFHEHFVTRPANWQPVVNSILHKSSLVAKKNSNNSNASSPPSAPPPQRISAVAHSLGAALLLASYNAAPHLYDKIVIFEPPMFSAAKRIGFSIAFRFVPDSIVDKVHPLIKAALRKPKSFKSREEFEAWARSRKLFKSFDPGVLESFCANCIVPRAGGEGFELDFSGTKEANVYKSTPTDTPMIGTSELKSQYDFSKSNPLAIAEEADTGDDMTPGKVTFLYNDSYDFLDEADVDFLEEASGSKLENANIKFVGISGGLSHFWPLQTPENFAQVVAKYL